jgi:hypothetical protein
LFDQSDVENKSLREIVFELAVQHVNEIRGRKLAAVETGDDLFLFCHKLNDLEFHKFSFKYNWVQ